MRQAAGNVLLPAVDVQSQSLAAENKSFRKLHPGGKIRKTAVLALACHIKYRAPIHFIIMALADANNMLTFSTGLQRPHIQHGTSHHNHWFWMRADQILSLWDNFANEVVIATN